MKHSKVNDPNETTKNCETDIYKEKWIKKIKGCSNDEQIGAIINRIYEDGFQDGVDEGKEDLELC